MPDKLALLILGFNESENPTDNQIKEAFRKLSLICHPDTGGSVEMFRGLTLAKNLLLNTSFKECEKTSTNEDNNYSYSSESETEDKIWRVKECIKGKIDNIVLSLSRRAKTFEIVYLDNTLIVTINNIYDYKTLFTTSVDLIDESHELIVFYSVLCFLETKLNPIQKEYFNKSYTFENTLVDVSLTLLPWYKSFGRYF